jgi:thiol-disulfide isomerase/thioredoxin
MDRESISTAFPLGSTLPKFELVNVDGQRLGSEYLKDAKAALVAFGCNHCPYVKGSEEMLIKVVERYQSEGLKTVVINSNDAGKYPEDSFEKMKEKALARPLPYPYLYDESQQVAKLFDAACTPELYLFNQAGALVYHGTINDSPRDPSKVTKDYLSTAIEAVLAGKIPEPQFVHPLGCSIKWR